jgi:hypothetical protein
VDLFQELDRVPAHPPAVARTRGKTGLTRGAKDAMARKRVEAAMRWGEPESQPDSMCHGGDCPIFPEPHEYELLCPACRPAVERALAPSPRRH